MIGNGYRSLGYQRINGAPAATALTVPAGTSLILITPETQAIRWRDDGTDPTAAIGYPLAVGAELQYNGSNMAGLKVIEQAATAVINVTYFGAT